MINKLRVVCLLAALVLQIRPFPAAAEQVKMGTVPISR